jgi:hypothetical protein
VEVIADFQENPLGLSVIDLDSSEEDPGKGSSLQFTMANLVPGLKDGKMAATSNIQSLPPPPPPPPSSSQSGDTDKMLLIRGSLIKNTREVFREYQDFKTFRIKLCQKHRCYPSYENKYQRQ